jgi:hypothetical protein
MRLVAFGLVAPFLTLAGCGEKEATGNTASVDQAVSAQDFATSDATAIDAATGADANMAADVDINLYNDADAGVSGSTTNRGAPSARRRPTETNTAAPANDTQPSATAPATPATPPAETNTD